MNKETLKKAFREYKKAAGVDFAITAPDRLDDYTVEAMIDNASDIWSFRNNDDIQAILDNIEE